MALRHPDRVADDIERATLTSPRVDLDHSRDGAKDGRHTKLDELQKLRGRACRRAHREVIDFAEAPSDWAQCGRLDAWWHASRHAEQSFLHELPRAKDVYIVFEDDRHRRQAIARDAPLVARARKTAEGHLDGSSDQALDLFRGETLGAGEHDYLLPGHVG